MLHLKSYVGSIVLAGLLLQGCGSDAETTTADTQVVSATAIETARTVTALTDTINALGDNPSDADVKAAFDTLKLELSAPADDSTQTAIQRAGILDGITDSVGDALVGVLDTSVGDAVTTATFDVVLNSEGVTVLMIDLARDSEPLSEIMVNAMEADWSLAEKMCPMLRESTEFGEKFTALAEEQDIVGRFFFERIDANMYGCLTDAMLLSNNDAVHDESVTLSTNGYMGLLMDRYATDYFVTPDANTTALTAGGAETSDVRRDDKFVSLLLDTRAHVDYNSTTKTFEGHGDGNELINEKFFYSLFKTPGTTDAFVSAMQKVEDADAVNDTDTLILLMDNIFLGQPQDTTADADTMQGYLNIISIGSAMYDGIYGEVSGADTRTGAYGFASYSGAFIGFAGLIPANRYIPYGKAFINAGYAYADFHGINVWSGVTDAVKSLWTDDTVATTDTNTTDTNTTVAAAPARSAGLGVVSSDWYSDVTDLLWTAYENFNVSLDWGALYDSLTDSELSVMTEITNQLDGLKDEGNKAYNTIIDGRDENNNSVYPTTLTHNSLTENDNDTVYGFHGLMELAVQEDIYTVYCGNTSSYSLLSGTPTCNNDENYTMDSAKAAFTLPAFNELTWSFAYGTAKDGASAYISTIDADWIADLNNNTLITQYFTPDANNSYVPNWMLSINWLSLPKTYTTSNYADYDLSIDFNSGYLDVYVVSQEANLSNIIDFSELTDIVVSKVEMGNDTIIAVDENGQNVDAYYVYKIRVVSPAQVEALLAKLAEYKDTALTAVGLDTSNTANVDTTSTTDTNTTGTL